MLPYQFNQLDESEQIEIIWQGVHVANSQDEEHFIQLWKINSLYVELYIHKEYDVLRKILPFEEHELLDVYSPLP